MTVSSRPGSDSVSATLTFTATIVPSNEFALEAHDIGSGIVSAVATYHEYHSEFCTEKRPACTASGEILETIAYAGDGIDVVTGGDRMVARRYRRDRWPSRIPWRFAKR